MWLKSRLCVFVSIHGHRHAHLFLSVLFFLVSLYLVLKSFFHLFLNPAMVPDENSMEDPLCNSSFGSMVSLDYVTPDTLTVTSLQCQCLSWLMIDQGNLRKSKPTKSQNQIKRKPRLNGETRVVILGSRDGCKNSGKIWWMMKFHYRETLTPVLLMKFL